MTAYTLAAQKFSSKNAAVAIYYAIAKAASVPNVMVQWAAAANGPEIEVYELRNAGPIDKTSTSSGTSTNVTSGSVTTTNANDFLLGGCCVANAVSVGETGWTKTYTANGNGVQYLIPGASGELYGYLDAAQSG